MIHVYVFFITLALTVAAALAWGGAAERWTATLLSVAAGASVALPYHPGVSFHSLNAGLLIIDAALLVALVVVELRMKRTWLSWACAMQLLTVAVHLVKLYDPSLVPWMYSAAAGKLGYVVLMLLMLGTIEHHRQKKPAVAS